MDVYLDQKSFTSDSLLARQVLYQLRYPGQQFYPMFYISYTEQGFIKAG